MSDQPTGDELAPASTQTPDEGQSASEIDEAALKAHPLVQELERQKNAAEQKALSAEGRLKKVAEHMSDKKEDPKQEDSELDWKLDNNSRIKIVKDEYQRALTELKEAGAKETNAIRTAALELAERRRGVTVDTSDVERQAAMSSAPGISSRTNSNPVPLTEHDRRFGLTPERKKELQEKYPELTEEI